MDNKNSSYVKIGLAIAALGVTYVLAAVVIPRVFVSFTKAAPASKVSLEESRVIGQKILCRADGVDKCIVNVYVLDKDSKGVKGKQVELTGEAEVSPIDLTSDERGKFGFAITSKKEGQVILSASIGGMQTDKEIKVTFRN